MNRIGTTFSSRIRIWGLALMVVSLMSSSFSQEETNPRLFITDSHSWEVSGGFAGSGEGFGGAGQGGARPQTAEIIKTFGERCPRCTVTASKERADYVVILEHEGGKDPFSKDNKFALFNKEGDVIKSGSTRTLGNAVKEICLGITTDWRIPASKTTEPAEEVGPLPPQKVVCKSTRKSE
jgi:hypothetical protein